MKYKQKFGRFINDHFKLTLLLNHLAILYAFLLPISRYGASFVFFLIICIFLIRRNFKNYLFPILKNSFVVAVLIFYLINLIWLFGTENIDQAKQVLAFTKYVLFPIVFLSFIDNRYAVYIINGFVFGILLSEIFSYLMYFNQIPGQLVIYSIPIYESLGSIDPSPFIHHSFYATYLSFTVTILAYKFVSNRNNNFTRAISLFFIISISANLSLVGGRIGYVSYCLALAFLFLYISKKSIFNTITMYLVSIVLIFAIMYSSSSMFHNKINETKDILSEFYHGIYDFNDSLGARFGFYYYSSDVIKNNLIFGVGTGDYMDEVRHIIPETRNNNYIKHEIEHPHNQYIMILLQFGIIGLIAYFNILYQACKQNYNNKYLRFVKYVTILIVSIAFLTETITAVQLLPMLMLMLSLTLSLVTLPIEHKPKFTAKILIFYLFIIFLSFINAKLHFIIYELSRLL